MRDLKDDGWLDELPGDYDVVATVNALHWFDAERAGQLIEDVHGTLRSGGLFLLAEPAFRGSALRGRIRRRGRRSSLRATRSENWERFWSRANALLGYDHTALLGSSRRRSHRRRAVGRGLDGLLERAGFELIDVLLRDADQVVIGALKSDD